MNNNSFMVLILVMLLITGCHQSPDKDHNHTTPHSAENIGDDQQNSGVGLKRMAAFSEGTIADYQQHSSDDHNQSASHSGRSTAGYHQSASEGHHYSSVNERSSQDKHDHNNEIFFSLEQAEAVGLATKTVAPDTFHGVIKTSGHIEPAQGDESMIVATSDGVIRFTNPSIAEGMSVRAGETIATLSAKHLQDGDPAARARIEYETARSEFQRAETLVKDQIISEKEYEQARFRYETAKTAYDAHASNISPEGVNVVALVNGYLANRLVVQGEYVSVGQPIASIARNTRLQLRAEAPESRFHQLGDISTAHFKTAYSSRLYKLTELNGRLVSYGRAVNTSFFIPVTFEFENPGNLLAGAYTEVYLLTTPREEVITVPTSAVTEEQGLFFVYLQMDEEHYKKQEVILGQSDGYRIEVIDGLNDGDRVVIKGVIQVKLAAAGSVMPEGHSHSH